MMNRAPVCILCSFSPLRPASAQLAFPDEPEPLAPPRARQRSLDLGVVWRITPCFGLSVWGQNLLRPERQAFSGLQVERSAHATAMRRH